MVAKRIVDFIAGHEGRERVPYVCTAGEWSWGIGRNLKDNPPTVDELLVLLRDGPEKAIDVWFANDVERSHLEARSIFAGFAKWPEARQAAIVSILFNLGLTKFLGFRKMVAALKAEDWGLAADESLDSARAKQLPRRAAEEAKMIRTGEWLT